MDMLTIALSVFGLQQLADGVLTYIGLKRKGVSEGNPIGRFLMDKLGVIPAILLAKLGATGIMLGITSYYPDWRLLIIPIMIYCAVIVMNLELVLDDD